MRNPLHKRIPRELKKNLGRYCSVFLLLTATIMIGSSFMAVNESATRSLEENQRESRVENGQFEVYDELDDKVIEELEELGLEIVPNTYLTIEEFDETATLRIFEERSQINMPSVFEGSLPNTENEIAVDRLFAANRGIEVGQTITLRDEDYEVTATISLPDYNSLFKDNSAILMDTQNFGPCIVTKEGFCRLDGSKITHLYSYRYTDSDITEKEEDEIVEDSIECLLSNQIQPVSYIQASDNQSIMFLSEDMGKDGPMIAAFVYILIAVLAFVFAVLISNTIESEAMIIGTLRANGYTKGEMVVHYLAPTVIVSVAASAIGNLIGYTLMVKPFLSVYYNTYCMPPVNLEFNWSAFVLTTVVPVVIMVVINLLVLVKKLSLSPLRFLRNDIRNGKQKKAIKLPNVSFFSRFRMRIMLQNTSSYIVLFVGIFLSSFLLMFGIGMMPLITHYVDTVDDSLSYEYQYILKAPFECDEGEKLTVYELETDSPITNEPIGISIYGLQEDSEYFDFIPFTKSGEGTKNNKLSAVFSEGVAKKLGVTKGEIVTFEDSFNDERYDIEVSDIVVYQGVMVIFMPQSSLNEMVDYEEDFFNCYVSDTKLDIDEKYVARQINREDMTGAAAQMLVSFKEIIVIVSVFSVCIYLVMMYLLTKVVVEKNAIHIAFMKVFGYEEKEISKLYLRATTIIVIVSLFICIPAEIALFKVTLILVMSLVEGWIEFYLPWTTYAQIIGIGLVSYIIINSFHVHKVKKIPMRAALKQRE